MIPALLLLLPGVPDAPTVHKDRKVTVSNTNATVAIRRIWRGDMNGEGPWVEMTLDAPIPPDRRATFSLGNGTSCLYEFKMQFTDGYEQIVQNVNVCRGDTIKAT